MVDWKGHKTCIFGIQGSGKSMWMMEIYREFKHPIVFVVNEDDARKWAKLPGIYIWKANRATPEKTLADFKTFIETCRKWAMEGKIDLIIIDEADMFFRSNYDIDPSLNDIVLNHRHMGSAGNEGVALWLATRRPQDIPTKIVESSRYLVVFKLEGSNAIDRFKEINPKIPDLIKRLRYDKHDFIFKEIGKDPVIHKPL